MQQNVSRVVMAEVLSLTFVHDVPDRRSYSLGNASSARLVRSGSGLLDAGHLKSHETGSGEGDQGNSVVL